MPRQKVKATTILTCEQIASVKNGIERSLGPTILSAFRKYRMDTEGMVRFMCVGAKLRELREVKALELKQVAANLRVPQYRLRDIESSTLNSVAGEVLLRYAAFLGAGRWLKRWCSMNRSLAEQLGLIQSRVKHTKGGAAPSNLIVETDAPQAARRSR